MRSFARVSSTLAHAAAIIACTVSVAKVASFPVLAKAAKTSPEGHGSRFSSPKSDALVEIHGGLTKNKIVYIYNICITHK